MWKYHNNDCTMWYSTIQLRLINSTNIVWLCLIYMAIWINIDLFVDNWIKHCITTYFLQAYNDNPKHANKHKSISMYTPKPIELTLSYRLPTNVAKNESISMPTKLCATKKILEYSNFIRFSKQFIVMPYFIKSMTKKCPNKAKKTHRSRICSSLCVFIPICSWTTAHTNHVVSTLIVKPVRKMTKARASWQRR